MAIAVILRVSRRRWNKFYWRCENFFFLFFFYFELQFENNFQKVKILKNDRTLFYFFFFFCNRWSYSSSDIRFINFLIFPFSPRIFSFKVDCPWNKYCIVIKLVSMTTFFLNIIESFLFWVIWAQKIYW